MNIDRVLEAYRDASGQWNGCDWTTGFGPLGLNLDQLTQARARIIANATSGFESQCWRDASSYLAYVEHHAGRASTCAKMALELVSSGQLLSALSLARQACEIEREFHAEPVWRPFCESIESVMDEAGPIADLPAMSQPHSEFMACWSMDAPGPSMHTNSAKSSASST